MSDSLPFLSRELTADVPADDGTRALTRQLVRGDEDAWRAFHAGYRPRVRGLLRSVWMGPEEVLDDLVQETFLRAVRHMRTFDDAGTLWSWLTVLARSAAMDAGRKRSRWRRFLDRWRRELRPEPEEADGDLEVSRAIGRLPEEPARLLRMKYEECRSVRSIAGEMGITEKAVERRLARARRMVKRELERRGSDDDEP